MNIVLTGPMGSGKSTAGRAIAAALGKQFADTDELITQRTGMSIVDIFEKLGELKFREMERELIKEISKLDNQVISCGGGIVLQAENMRRLRKNGIIINLIANAETIEKRIGKEKDRPLFTKQNAPELLEKQLADRESRYKNADYFVDTNDKTPTEVVEAVLRLAKKPHIRICACIAEKNKEQCIKSIEEAVQKGAGLVELRLDFLNGAEGLKQIIDSSALPIIVTNRSTENGGHFDGSEKERTDQLINAIKCGADFVDVELEVSELVLTKALEKTNGNGTKLIISVHDFEKTPSQKVLNDLLEKAANLGDIAKIVTTANSIEDCERVLGLLKRSNGKKLIAFSMGEIGQFTRIVSPIMGAYLTYAAIGEKIAPGQLGLESLIQIYKELGLK